MMLPIDPDDRYDDLKKKNNTPAEKVETSEVDDKLIGDDLTIKQADIPNANPKENITKEENY